MKFKMEEKVTAFRKLQLVLNMLLNPIRPLLLSRGGCGCVC